MKNKWYLVFTNTQEKYITIFTRERKTYNKKEYIKELTDTINYKEIDTKNLKDIIHTLQREVKEREEK